MNFIRCLFIYIIALYFNNRAVVFLVHGLAEHSGRYVPLIKALTSGGIAVLTHDHHGHGLSDGERIFVNTFDDYVEDIFQHLKIADHRIGNLPLLLFGHSMVSVIIFDLYLSKFKIINS